MNNVVPYSAYSSNHGHVVAIETTDREAAIKLAAGMHNALETYPNGENVEEHFAEHIDSPHSDVFGATRPDVGSFAVSVARADDYEIKALKDHGTVYRVLAQTRNAAREIPSFRGIETLQAATQKAIDNHE